MAAENANETLASLRAQWEASRHKQTRALGEIQEALSMDRAPIRIECYDISNTQGTAAVGSMVVFERGVPNKNHYRRFNIRTVQGPDDFASMEEVLTRRFRRWQAAVEADGEKKPGKKPDASFATLPDLLIVDGGKGQLSRAVRVMEQFGLLGKIKVAGLAKREETIFLHGSPRPIMLPRKSEGLYLVQRVRDEAHRFAITAHRSQRVRQGIKSQLEEIPGIGPAKRNRLLQHFGSLEKIQHAEIDDLVVVQGINEALAHSIKAHFG